MADAFRLAENDMKAVLRFEGNVGQLGNVNDTEDTQLVFCGSLQNLIQVAFYIFVLILHRSRERWYC